MNEYRCAYRWAPWVRTTLLVTVAVLLTGIAAAQPFQWPERYVLSVEQGGSIQETTFGDIGTLQPYIGYGSATEVAILSLVGGNPAGSTGGPPIIYRDWVGNRRFVDDEGNYNLLWAENIEVVQEEQEFIVTLRQGWLWSDGTEMTADDVIAARTILGDPAVEANEFSCSVVDDEPTIVEKLGTYQYRLLLPSPQVNALGSKDCGSLPAHVFMPIYEAEGAAGIRGMYGVEADVSTIVSGGPYLISEFSPGERLVLERNPLYGEFMQAADGSPLPGPDSWGVTITEDRNAQLSLVVTGQASFYWPTTLDEVRAVQQAVQGGTIGGRFLPNIGPTASIDFITYNFNNSDSCKADMFRAPEFRQAISIMIDRNALVQAAVGGLGFPGRDFNGDASAPFNAPQLPDFEFDPEAGVALLESIGFSELDADNVLFNPDTGCRVAFDLQFNSGNNRRGQLALVISQTVAPFGVAINPLEVSADIWTESIIGDLNFDETGQRTRDFDAQIWGLVGGDVDNPSSPNVLAVNVNLNNWNKSATDVEDWEVEMTRLTNLMNATLDLEERIDIYNQRADLMREYLPLTPLINQAFHFYHNLSGVWPDETLDDSSIQAPYRPGGYRGHQLMPGSD